MITVFFDGKCGLCRREIEHYRNVAERATVHGRLDWVDVTESPHALAHLGVSPADALLRLHALDEDRLLRGADVFLAIWRELPGWRWLAAVGSTPGFRHLGIAAYEVFARLRFWWHPHCRVAWNQEDAPSRSSSIR